MKKLLISLIPIFAMSAHSQIEQGFRYGLEVNAFISTYSDNSQICTD